MLADQEERGARATATSPPMDSNLAAKEVSGTARRTGEGSLSLSLSLFLILSPVMSYAKPLSRPGRNHDRSSRELPRGTASYTNSRTEHGV